ncbi:MAG: hypothetical protein QOG14_4422 [Mycobacterium sp.]|nr:hypothetical protein [Mycobacterium sp.]MDT5412202.1 hypothetical protein [Mycobacterium sp.]
MPANRYEAPLSLSDVPVAVTKELGAVELTVGVGVGVGVGVVEGRVAVGVGVEVGVTLLGDGCERAVVGTAVGATVRVGAGLFGAGAFAARDAT